MAVSTTALAIRYAGNGSTSTAYTIPFPFLDVSHIYAAVSSDGVEAPVLLELGDYTVTRLADGSGGSLTTAEAVTSPAEILIFRTVPLTQPTVFQSSGPFPAKANETAIDRLLMQVQQLNRRLNKLEGVEDEDYIYLPGSNPGITQTVKIWESSTERGVTTPTAVGQLGVEINTQTVWIAQSTAVGDWEEFGPKYSNKLVIGFTADAGNPGGPQTQVANLLSDWECDAVLFGGDNSYNGAANYNADWAAFASWITSAQAFPALGNHELDDTGWEARHTAKFGYLPGNKRYYTVVLGGGLVQIFVLNSGYDSIFDLQEPDGNAVGSVQHAWFVEQLAASKARWKIAMFHHPPVTLDSRENRVAEAMAWPELAQLDMILCGHTHLSEIIKWQDTMLVNLSNTVTSGVATLTAGLQGSETVTSYPLWARDGFGVGRIVATQNRLAVEVWRVGLSNELLHTRSHDDFAILPIESKTYRVVASGVAIGTLTDAYVCTLAEDSVLLGAAVAMGEEGDDWDFTLYANGNAVLEASVGPFTKFYLMTAASDPTQVLPAGTQITLTTPSPTGSLPASTIEGLEVILYFKRLS